MHLEKMARISLSKIYKKIIYLEIMINYISSTKLLVFSFSTKKCILGKFKKITKLTKAVDY